VEHARVLNWVNVDASRWPVVHCTLLGALGADEFGILLERLELYLRRKERHAYIIDLSGVELPSRARRAVFLQGLQPHEPRIGTFVAGVALVLPPATLPFTRSTMLLARKALAPWAIFDSVEAASAWCSLQLTEGAIPSGEQRRVPG
jgi:hypothetical protein